MSFYKNFQYGYQLVAVAQYPFSGIGAQIHIHRRDRENRQVGGDAAHSSY
jgi:hypothetical protein